MRSRPTSAMRATRVYVIGEASGAGPVKIGFACDTRQRLQTLQTGSPVLLAVLHVTELASEAAARQVERIAHNRLRHKRSHGEWFAVTAAEAASLVIEIAGPHPKPAAGLSAAALALLRRHPLA